MVAKAKLVTDRRIEREMPLTNAEKMTYMKSIYTSMLNRRNDPRFDSGACTIPNRPRVSIVCVYRILEAPMGECTVARCIETLISRSRDHSTQNLGAESDKGSRRSGVRATYRPKNRCDFRFDEIEWKKT